MAKRKNNELPDDIYIAFVETLFRDGSTLMIGMLAQAVTAGLVYSSTSEPIYLGIGLLMLMVGTLRLISIGRYRNAPRCVDRAEARARENVYIFWGTLHASTIGLFCFVGIYWVPSQFAEIASVCVTLASVTSIAGRNYGSPRLVMAQIVAATWPISLGFLLRGDIYHVILGLLSAPFFFAIRKFAKIVREVLFDALSEKKKANTLAERFNRALNTMSHGLVMLGPDGRVVVANSEAAHLMSLASPDALLGRTMHGLLRRGVAGGMLAMKDCHYIEAQLTRALREGRDRKVLVSFTNGQHYEFSAREGRNELGVVTFEDVTKRVQAEEKIRTMARYDSLTGLINRAYFHELVSEAMAVGDPQRLCALVVFDLDDFKSVNDTLGHPVGDGLIYAVGERLSTLSGDGVWISRFGGDEFIIYFDRINDRSELEQILSDAFVRLEGEADVAGHALRIQASAGAVLANPDDGGVDAMIVKADLALHRAKNHGKNNWRLFETAMDEAFRSRQLMKADLRNAVEARRLRVVYQPIVSMTTMRISSCEALCRWDHPELGPISPAVFIPLAEEMGIISDITTFMLQAACHECAKWPLQTGVSINLSGKDFRDRSFIGKVQDALSSSGLAPGRLEIEVTETALLDDKSLTSQWIAELKALGVRIALDDFGTGYSSLSYLHKLPLDKVKIDRSFLADVTHNKRSLDLLKGVVGLSKSLGLTVTMEGVETFEQLKLLAVDVRPDLVQGFLFGSALSASGIETMSTTSWPFAKDLKAAKRAKST
ncbi:EAL domain-containing protein [Mesorhizobium sp. NBSH29]|uniref:putative bifunctional diguanylate cyclase/phosphodiesterase n=1 Tax=Mesorhizobium sp. NBSH29 TaxID=2654249 RepID=UPI0018969B85|nr:EAL domain-containing protein [Mesorhizobium sp. NBSH29]QPC85523.1 EAL domain-containing protein [Mesorhizobium sp. NBSH29]